MVVLFYCQRKLELYLATDTYVTTVSTAKDVTILFPQKYCWCSFSRYLRAVGSNLSAEIKFQRLTTGKCGCLQLDINNTCLAMIKFLHI